MLIRFRVENFRSIRDEQEFSFVASALSEHQETLVHVDQYNLDLLRAAAIYGPNASGKSTIFQALGFMRTAIVESHKSWSPMGGVPRTPFALAANAAVEPSSFSVDVLINGIRYEYGFRVDSVQIQEEWLYAYPRGRRQEWFTRDASRDLEFAFSRSLTGENRAISSFTRPNSLYLSTAAQNNHEQLMPLYRWFSEHLWIVDDSTRNYFERYTVEQCRDERYRDSLLGLLASADLGVTSIEFSEDELAPEGENALKKVPDALRAQALRTAWRTPQVRLVHTTEDPFWSVALPFDQESRGTRTLFSLLGILNWCLHTGGTLLIDELDQSLHSHLACRIVTIFSSPALNPRGAQLLFNTHDTNLLNHETLRRDQVWFTEKGYDGATRLFPLTDFHARKHENLERGYLQGRYGAVPAAALEGFTAVQG